MTTVGDEKKHNPFFFLFFDLLPRRQDEFGWLRAGSLGYLFAMNIGFVGVGRMGANMARRLKDQGFHVTALYDAHRPAATTLAQELGSFASQSLGEVTASADVIITVVSDDAAMREIFTAPDGNLLANAQGRLFINCATISPEVHLEVENLARKIGAQTLEACMASSITQAREGTLYLMCGWREILLPTGGTHPAGARLIDSLYRQIRRSRQGQGPR
jgi:hypothetical protein